MARSENQKLKLLYIEKLLRERTDDKHYITTNEIIEALKSYGINAERKSIYSDMEALEDFGLEIEKIQCGNKSGYHLISRPFELPELKLLVDSVQASKFISEKKSNELIKKLAAFSSQYESNELKRQVYVRGRVKTTNENIYYNVDTIHEAINGNRKISFKYYEWTVDKKLVEKKNGKTYVISPWALTWNDENYYLIGYDSEANSIKHYRVDKMKKTTTLDEAREGKQEFVDFDITAYSKQTFGMFGGEREVVKLECSNNIIGVVIDHFGQDIMAVKADENHFTVSVDVIVSQQFLAWVFGLQGNVKILSPTGVVEKLKETAKNMLKQYE